MALSKESQFSSMYWEALGIYTFPCSIIAVVVALCPVGLCYTTRELGPEEYCGTNLAQPHILWLKMMRPQVSGMCQQATNSQSATVFQPVSFPQTSAISVPLP